MSGQPNRPVRLVYLVSHPIQYQAPLLRLIAKETGIDLLVLYASDISVAKFRDPEFKTTFSWDVPLLDGYRHQFLPAIGRTDKLSFFRPFVYGLKQRIRESHPDVIWIHGWGRLNHIRAVLAARKLGIKVLLRGESGLHLPRHSWFKQWLKDRFLRWLFRRSDGFLAIGKLNREFYLRYGASPEWVFMMPYAVDNVFFQEQACYAASSREALREKLQLKPGRLVFLYASKIIERKRAEDLLEAYIRLSPDGQKEPEAYLLFIGDGDRRAALETRASQLGWNSIRFLGFRNQTELPTYYDLCDVFVLPSVEEPWGLVVNEVMNAGRAVIVSDEVGCYPNLVQDGVNGFVFKARDVASLHAAMARFVYEPPMAKHMGRKSLEIVRTFGFEADVQGLKQALVSVVGLT